MKKRLLLLLLLPLTVFAYDPASEYLIGGEKFIPDSAYGKNLCEDSHYYCRRVRRGETWQRLFRNKEERDLVMRVNRTNVALMYRPFVVIPKHLSDVRYMELSPFPTHYDTHGHRLLFVDLSVYAFAAYDEKGVLKYWGPASGGRPYCEDTDQDCLTKTGRFSVYRMKGKNCTSKTYPIEQAGGAPMPYCMFYYRGFAIHGSTLSGFVDRSRGCVRVFYDDAKWLNENFVKVGTKVVVMR